ncbi:MAG: cytochrome c biogenesis protein CcdA [Candidatus Goldbacteria bacterium]|nr:cytochrome c biogenesis protein CcdA [Candidatus Goldiibacteriota bacterium]
MMEIIFTKLTNALKLQFYIAIIASFLWGFLSVILSPCHLASIPLIVGFVGSQGDKASIKKAFLLSLLFSIGILITIAIIGIITGIAGMIAGDIGIWGNLLVGIIFILVGLYFFNVIDFNFLNFSQPQYERKGYFAAFVLGLIFGGGLSPCTFAYMAPMLAVAFKFASENILYSITLILFFGMGHCFVIIFAGIFTEIVEKYLKWSDTSQGVFILKKICGTLLFIAAGYMFFTGIVR